MIVPIINDYKHSVKYKKKLITKFPFWFVKQDRAELELN